MLPSGMLISCNIMLTNGNMPSISVSTVTAYACALDSLHEPFWVLTNVNMGLEALSSARVSPRVCEIECSGRKVLRVG